MGSTHCSCIINHICRTTNFSHLFTPVCCLLSAQLLFDHSTLQPVAKLRRHSRLLGLGRVHHRLLRQPSRCHCSKRWTGALERSRHGNNIQKRSYCVTENGEILRNVAPDCYLLAREWQSSLTIAKLSSTVRPINSGQVFLPK